MQKPKLPLTIDALRAAQKRLDYSGLFLSEQVTRLASSVVSVDSDVTVELSFNIDSQKLTVITGQSQVTVTLCCERCGKPFQQTVNSKYCFSPVVHDDQAESLPESYEPISVNEFGEVDLLAMVEDEIILSLPLVPIHKDEHCEVSEADMVFGELPQETEKPNPFAVLAGLKQNKE